MIAIWYKLTNFYNLDIIISVDYSVKSHRGVHFRKWAAALLKEYLIKGSAMNDYFLRKHIPNITSIKKKLNSITQVEKDFIKQIENK